MIAVQSKTTKRVMGIVILFDTYMNYNNSSLQNCADDIKQLCRGAGYTVRENGVIVHNYDNTFAILLTNHYGRNITVRFSHLDNDNWSFISRGVSSMRNGNNFDAMKNTFQTCLNSELWRNFGRSTINNENTNYTDIRRNSPHLT